MCVRGLVGRCPNCGSGGLFQRWIHMQQRCPRCGLWFERTEGHWIGAIGMNTVASFGLLAVGMATAFAITWPDPPAVPLAIGFVTFAVLFPLAFYPASKTLWTAIDLCMRPLTAGDFSAEGRHRAGSGAPVSPPG
jgi:uncharacterized protein (DUF983 family)